MCSNKTNLKLVTVFLIHLLNYLRFATLNSDALMYKNQFPKYLKFLYSLIYDTFSSRINLNSAMRYIKFHGLKGAFKRVNYLFTLFDSNSLSYLTTHYRNKINYKKLTSTHIKESKLRIELKSFHNQPLISIIMPCFNSNIKWLHQSIESVKNQIYPNWELCIADDASTNPECLNFLRKLENSDSRIKIIYRKENGHISKASNSALSIVTGQFVALLDHDDRLAKDALFWIVDTINKKPQACLIYSDEDKIDHNDKRQDPYFKCDWNYHLFLSQNLISHIGVYKTSILKEIGGFRTGFEGSQDYDLALRFIEKIDPEQIIHIPRVLYHWRIHKNSTALDVNNKPYAVYAAKRAIEDHLKRNSIPSEVHILPNNIYRVKYKLPDDVPMVSIIIPTRDNINLLKKCINSITDKTTYKNFEIRIIDNQSSDPKTLNYFDELRNHSHIKVENEPREFNYAAINNSSVNNVTGSFICFLNDDTEVLSADWLDEMVSIALQKDVGVVGAKLLYPNDTIQHGGIILGIGGVASHAHKFFPKNHNGYFGRAGLKQEFSAVTGACMLVSKSLFIKLGGFNELDLPIAYNDVDFCLRVRKLGKKVVWTPFAELYHHESVSRVNDTKIKNNERFLKEIKYMNTKWGDWIKNDPAYSPNLSLDSEDFGFAWPSRIE